MLQNIISVLDKDDAVWVGCKVNYLRFFRPTYILITRGDFMNVKILALVTALSVLTSVITVLNSAQPLIAKTDDRCITAKSKDKTSSSTICVTENHEYSIKDLKKVCKVFASSLQCSTSPTGNGISANFSETQTRNR